MQRPSRRGDLKSLRSGPVTHPISFFNPLVQLNIIFTSEKPQVYKPR